MPMTQTEAHRLAAAINQLRPEWPLASLSAFIHKNLMTRAYRDAAVALTWVAADSESLNPGRLLEAGPWWKATQAQDATVSAISMTCPEHPSERAWNCQHCEATTAAPTDDFLAAKAALKLRDRPKAAHPEPPTTNLAATRERADAQEAQ